MQDYPRNFATPLLLAAIAAGTAFVAWNGLGIPPLPSLVTGLVLPCILLLALSLFSAKQRVQALDRRSEELARVKVELETTVRSLKLRHRELQNSEQRYRGLVEQQGDVILRRLPDGRLSFVNDAFCRTFGASRDNALGRPFAPPYHPGEKSEVPPSLDVPASSRRMQYEQCVKTVSGWRWIVWEDQVIRNETGSVIEVQSIGRDVTEQKQMESALREARDKAEEASRAKPKVVAVRPFIRPPFAALSAAMGSTLETAKPRSPDAAFRGSWVRVGSLAA